MKTYKITSTVRAKTVEMDGKLQLRQDILLHKPLIRFDNFNLISSI